MPTVSRREMSTSALAGAAASRLSGTAAAGRRGERGRPKSGSGIEGRRHADLADGTSRNPIVAGDPPAPAVRKDGADHDVTFSSFASRPAEILGHSRDRVGRSPDCPALWTPIGSL
jgi:hypothetical protein